MEHVILSEDEAVNLATAATIYIEEHPDHPIVNKVQQAIEEVKNQIQFEGTCGPVA